MRGCVCAHMMVTGDSRDDKVDQSPSRAASRDLTIDCGAPIRSRRSNNDVWLLDTPLCWVKTVRRLYIIPTNSNKCMLPHGLVDLQCARRGMVLVNTNHRHRQSRYASSYDGKSILFASAIRTNSQSVTLQHEWLDSRQLDITIGRIQRHRVCQNRIQHVRMHAVLVSSKTMVARRRHSLKL